MSSELIQSGPLWLYVFDPSTLGVWADPQGGANVAPHASADAVRFSGAQAVLDGPMFGHATADGNDATSPSDRVEYGQADAARGISFDSTRPSDGATISVVNGVASASDGWSPASGASAAVQGYPAMIRGGQNVAVAQGYNAVGHNGDPVDRAGLAILSDGRLAFVIAPYGIDMEGFATAAQAAGAVELVYGDGGGSGSLHLADGTYHGSSEHRRVATWLTAGSSAAVVSDALWDVAWLIALLGIGAGLAWWVWESWRGGRGRGARRNPSRVRARRRRRR